jgi:hypothetical protein
LCQVVFHFLRRMARDLRFRRVVSNGLVVQIGTEELVPQMHADHHEVWMDGRRDRQDVLHRHLLRDKEGVLREGRVVLANTAALVDPNIQKRGKEGETVLRRRGIEVRRDVGKWNDKIGREGRVLTIFVFDSSSCSSTMK